MYQHLMGFYLGMLAHRELGYGSLDYFALRKL